MGIWLDRLTRLLKGTPTPAVTIGGSELGLPLVLARMLESPGFGWIEAGPRISKDPVMQGNSLAAALNQATGTRLFLQGLPAVVQLQRLKGHARDLPPIRMAVTGAELVPELVSMLVSHLPSDAWLLLDYSSELTAPQHHSAVDAASFLLTVEEAMQLAPGGLDEATVLADLQRAGWRRPAFVSLINARLSRHPATDVRQSQAENTADLFAPNLVLAALVRQKRYEEALELAVQAAPRLVEQVIRKAGPEFTRRGQLNRLHVLLSSLDEPWSGLAATLEWRLVAGVASSDYRELLPQVDEFLESNPAPDLRARRAGLLPPEQRSEMAQDALRLARTPLTLWQAGRMASDTESAITLLQESVRLAEDAGLPYDIARNAGALAEAYMNQGDLQRSLHWGDWALSVLDEGEIADIDRRRRILNNLAFVAMLCGRTLGLKAKLQDLLLLDGPGMSESKINTLLTMASLKMTEGHAEQASAMAEAAVSGASRQQKAHSVHHRVLMFLAAGNISSAYALSEQALAISDGEVTVISSSARLARGMLLALAGDESARPILESVMRERSNQVDQRLMAYLYSLLLPGPRTQRPQELELPLSQLSPEGIRLLSAPADAFSAIWQDLLGGENELQVKVLGAPKATLAGEPLKLTKRMWEVLLVIALHPEGIGDEQLHDFLVRDSGGFGLSALRTHVSRVRNLVPISDTPYRLEVPYTVDLLELRQAIRAGDLRAALRLARGPVLPGSETPGIQDLRADAAAELEQAVYGSDDPEAVYSLAEELADDIGLWERSRDLLPASDARRAVANARIGRLREQFT